MKYFISLYLATLILSACTSNTIYKKPEDLIPEKQMVKILTDLYLAKGAYSVTDKYGRKNTDYVPLIYKKYGIDSARFSRSNIYYMSRIDKYEVIYKQVESELLRIKARDSLENYDKRIPDQLKNKKHVQKK